MTTRLDPIYGLHADSMNVQRRRMEVLASNIANSDTPNYQARDIDFAKVLAAKQQGVSPGQLEMTSPMHLAAGGPNGADNDADLQFRSVLQPSVDGNTVDTQVEQAAFADASLHYQASLSFASGGIKSLLTAITGS